MFESDCLLTLCTLPSIGLSVVIDDTSLYIALSDQTRYVIELRNYLKDVRLQVACLTAQVLKMFEFLKYEHILQ